jgi:hypothetical protein
LSKNPNRMAHSMAERYKLSATPELFTEGEYKGKLKGVTFIATSSRDETDSIEWFTRNRGQFASVFSKIMDADLAQALHAGLMEGDQVEFPGLYEECQFARGFMFEWSPIYFVTPPIYAFGN